MTTQHQHQPEGREEGSDTTPTPRRGRSRIRPLFPAVFALVALLCAGCASSPAVRYYDLVTEAPGAATKTSDALIGLGPFTMPEYLKRPHIVLRGQGNDLVVAEFDRWAEPPDLAFTRWLGAETDHRFGEGVVVAYPYAALGAVDYKVRGAVRRWDADTRGEAVLVVQWGVTAADGTARTAMRTSSFSARAADAKDYQAIVAALRVTLDAFADAVVAELTRILAADAARVP
jgi:uncharacterized lipoprotein YmbA